MTISLREVLSYAFGASVPEAFARRLLEGRSRWDPEFARRLNDLAYELRPDLAVWELTLDDEGRLCERLLPLIPEV